MLAVLDVLLTLTIASAKADRQRILVARLDGIGDFIVWLDAARALRELYPKEQYTITLLANQDFASLAQALPHFDEVWELDRRRFFRDPLYRWGILRKVRKGQFGLVLQPTHSRTFWLEEAIIRVTGAPERVGSAGDASNMTGAQKRMSDRRYTRQIAVSPPPVMELDRNAEFVRGLGLANFRASLPQLPPLAQETRVLPENYFVLFPGGGWAGRLWPAEKFAIIGQRTADVTGWTGVICGGPGEVAFRMRLVGMLVNVGLNLWLIPRYGGVGAAVSTVVAEFFALYFCNLFSSRTREIFVLQTFALLSFGFYSGDRMPSAKDTA